MLPLLIATLVQDPYVRTHDQEVRVLHRPGTSAPVDPSGRELAFPPVCSSFTAGRHGEAVPGGGTLNPVAFANPATIIGPAGSGAKAAFVAQVSGSTRNQGVFVHDGTTLTPIVVGCGALGGGGSTGTCGDPAPVGGTFSGFFTGTVFAPAVNANGDVLFYAEVVGGTTSRGLFLYQAAGGSVVKVAGIGDVSPLGGTFAMIGPGSLNVLGEVAFLASGTTAGPSDVFLWSGGVVTKIAAVGDPAPLGSTYQYLGSEWFGFADGTNIPAGPVPDINDSGRVVFRAITFSGRRGIVGSDRGANQAWIVRDQEATPAGGTFFDLQGANVNANGEIAFFADVNLGGGNFTAGWFAGTTGNWRKCLAFGDPVGTGTCNGLAFSRNPMSPLDDAGNVMMWTNVLLTGGGTREHLVVSAPDGALTVVAKRTDPTALGGTYNGFDAWPSLDPHGRGTINASVSGVAGVFSAHFVFEACPAASATVRNGSGANALCFTADPPVLGTTWTGTVDATAHAGASSTRIYFHALPSSGTFVAAGEILVDLASPRYALSTVAGGGVVVHSNAVPNDMALVGLPASLQALIVGGGLELCNAVDVVVGY